MTDTEQQDLTALTVDLLSAYFASNSIESDKLSELIRTTHTALKDLNAAPAAEDPSAAYVPAVSVRKSLASPDVILSMIDGKPYKTLKRHLGSNGLTPAEYRERYKLPHDYPLVSKSYSEHRRKVAADLGLGRTVRTKKETEVASAVTAKPAAKSKAPTAPKAKSAAAPKAKTAAPVVEAALAPDASATAKPARKTPAPKAKAAKVAAAPQAATPAPAKTAPARKSKLSLASLKAPKAAG